MFNDELKAMLPEIITSWEIIAVTIALVIFMYMVSYVSRTHHRPRMSKSKPQRAKKEKAKKLEKNPDELVIEEQS